MCIQPLLISVLIVCSTNGFLELFRIRSWPVATSKSLSLTYGKPDVSCNSLADIYLGKRKAGLMKEFCNFCSLVMAVSETVIVDITHIRILVLRIVYRFAKLFVGLVPTFG